MKTRPVILLSAAAGCLIGYLGIRLSASQWQDTARGETRRAAGTGAGTAQAGSSSPFSAESHNERTHDERRNFASLMKDAPVMFERNKPFKDVERMDAGQLKPIILECILLTGDTSPLEDRRAASGVMSVAVRELYKREGERALEWAAAEAPANQRSMILSQLLVEVAKETPDLMKTWADRYRGEYGDEWAARFKQSAVSGAINRGAAELLRVRELLQPTNMPFFSHDFPEGFDFHLLITKSKPDSGFQNTIAYWAAQDKEAAWNGVKEVMAANDGSGASYFGAVFRGVLTMEGDTKAASWLVEKLGDVPKDTRDRALQSLGAFPLGSNAISAVIRAFPDPADKVAYASYQFSSFRPESGVAALRALDSPQLQTEALMATASRHASYKLDGPQKEKTREQFNSTMDQLQLDPQARETIMEALEPPPTNQQ